VNGKPEGGLENEHLHPLKAAHPDWVIPVSFLVAGHVESGRPRIARIQAESIARSWRLATISTASRSILRGTSHVCRLAGSGTCAEEATEFMRMARSMTLEVGARRGRPMLLAAKSAPHAGGLPDRRLRCGGVGPGAAWWMC